MIGIGFETFKKPFTVSAIVSFSDNSSISIPSSKIALSGSHISESSGANVLPLGFVVGKSFNLCLINNNGEYNSYDWYGAVITLTLDYGDNHTVTFNDLTVTEPPETTGLVIEMTAVDNVWRLDKPWSSTLVYPATLRQMYGEIITLCGIPYTNIPTAAYGFNSITVAEKPEGEYTCREMLGYIAAACCGNFMVRNGGRLVFVSMNPSTYNANNTVTITEWTKLSKAIHNVTITGVQVEDEDGEVVLAGNTGYVIELDASPITKGQELSIVTGLNTILNGKSMRRFEGSTYNFVKPEVFDNIRWEENGAYIYSVITEMSFNLSGGSDFSCQVETPRSVGKSYDPAARAVIAARELVASEKSARELSEAALAQAIAAKSGLYETTETAQGGGTIYYLHDKSTLAESTNVIKLTSEALGLSTDGGQTYPVGIMINGDVIARILTADGVNADWIDTGTLVVKDDNYNILFQADIDTGYVYMDGMRVDDGVVTIGAADSNKKMTISDSGVEIKDHGITTARFSDHGAIFPGNVTLDKCWILGNYQVLARSDGGIRIVAYEEY